VNIKDFHYHLDRCSKCSNEPFILCAIGEELVREAAGVNKQGHCGHAPKCTRTGPPDERDPLGCCNCGTRAEEAVAALDPGSDFYVPKD